MVGSSIIGNDDDIKDSVLRYDVFFIICIYYKLYLIKTFFNLNQISESDSPLEIAKLEIYQSLSKCEIHIQGA